MKWETITGFDNYMVSDSGLVKSIYRKVITTAGWYGTAPHHKTVRERILSPNLTKNGYLFVCLRNNNKHHSKKIHHLVMEAFVGPRPEGLVVLHKDNDRLNNSLINLEYGTMAKNTQDYFKSIGKRNGFVHIGDIQSIIGRITQGEKIVDIAREYNVTRNDIAVLNKIILIPEQNLK